MCCFIWKMLFSLSEVSNEAPEKFVETLLMKKIWPKEN